MFEAIDGRLRVSVEMEPIFEIRDAEEGGYCAHALGHTVFAEDETWEELRGNILETVSLHFEDAKVRPLMVQLHYLKDELPCVLVISERFEKLFD